MCGIGGVAGAGALGDIGETIDALGAALVHRGPDGHGSCVDETVALAHRRLSIIDVAGGAQPIGSDQGGAIVVNGEIYNFPELRAELGADRFRTGSDSEAALVAYHAMGEGFTEALRGMYALALHDPAQNRLILHRDPFGIKPLYYAQTADRLAFASEPQALFRAGLVRAELDLAKAAELMQLKFTTGEETPFRGVRRVPPGASLVVEGGEVVGRSRSDPFAHDTVQAIDAKAALARLDEELTDSVRVHVRSDVPYGLFLSGGVDSCSIAAAMAQLGLKDFPCYTARFDSASVHDETEVARAVARAVGARHVEVAITEADFWATLPEVARHVDDPSLDPAMIPITILARRAARDVKVVLCGNGGDEVFAGYRRYEGAVLPGPLRKRALRTRGQFEGSGLGGISDAPWRDAFAETARAARAKTATRLQGFQATDGADYLPNYNLGMLDRCLMAHGVEGRTPLLDRQLSAFGFTLPDRLKVRGLRGKWLLRQWLQGAAPQARPFARKRGFSVPVHAWVAARAPSLAEFVCGAPGMEALFDVDHVRALFREPGDGRGALRWPLLFFAAWSRTHLGGERDLRAPL